MENKIYKKLLAYFGASAVLLGAIGSHYFKSKLNVESFEIFKTANFYHFVHVLAMAFIFILIYLNNKKVCKLIFLLFALGIVLFSGSLYLIACKNLLKIDFPSIFYLITPFGGLLFMFAWLLCLKIPEK